MHNISQVSTLYCFNILYCNFISAILLSFPLPLSAWTVSYSDLINLTVSHTEASLRASFRNSLSFPCAQVSKIMVKESLKYAV